MGSRTSSFYVRKGLGATARGHHGRPQTAHWRRANCRAHETAGGASQALAASCDDIRPGYRRRIVQRHVIYFRIESYGIAVVRILHDRMEATRHL